MLQTNDEEQEVLVYGEIGPAWAGMIDANEVNEALTKFRGKHVTVRLNTPGGSSNEGVNIYNMLQRHPGGVTTIVDSLAASMGSYILQAGERRIVAGNSMVMIHDPWTIAIGNAAEMIKMAEVLDKYAQRMIPDYAKRSGKTEEEMKAIMAAETWYGGQEVIDAGCADEMIDDAKALAARPDVAALSRYARKVPQSLLEAAKKRAAAIKRPPLTVDEAKMLAESVR